MIKQKNFLMILVLAAVFLCSGLAQARVAQSVWFESAPEDADPSALTIRSRTEALQAAFANAVFDEALDIIGYPVSDVRQKELKKFLRPEAKKYVLSYRELGTTRIAGGSGQEMSVEVSVNRTSLTSVVKRLGFFKTRTAPVLYSPQYSGVKTETWEELGRLHQLYALRPDYNAPLALVMNQNGGIWELSLQGAGEPIIGQSKDLDAAWYAVWGQYFSLNTKPQQTVAAKAGVLQVRGWLFPDGVEAFDRLLRDWVGSASGAKLEAVVIESDSVVARWVIRSNNTSLVLSKLSEYVNGRGLTYEFQSASE